jgi:ankyrin repeat protein
MIINLDDESILQTALDKKKTLICFILYWIIKILQYLYRRLRIIPLFHNINFIRYIIMNLIYAARNYNIGRVREFLDRGVDPNIRDVRGNTALITASSRGNTDIVRLLLERDADPNFRNLFGDTALIEASIEGHINIVRLLLNNNADINIRDSYGWTALRMASSYGHIDIVEFLLNYGADPNIIDNDGNTALFKASYNGHINIVILLLDNGADLNIQNDRGDTALTIAESEGHNDIARLIRDHIDLQMPQQNLAFMKYFLDRDDLDIDTASRIFGNERSYNSGVNIRMMDEHRRDPLTKSKQRLATIRGIRDNHSVLQYLREPELMRNIDSYLTSMRPYPSVHSRMMLEDKKGGSKRRKNYTRKRY